MKKLKLLLTGLLVSFIASSQAGQINQINIINFTAKSVLPGTVDSWLTTPAALVLTAQKVPGAQPREPMMVLQIRSGGAIICGNTMPTAKRVDPFDVRVFTTADLAGMLGNCHELKAGTYSICVQFFNIDKVAISREVCKDFRVEDAAVEYAPPTLIIPDDGKKFSANDLMQPLTFRWTPLVPKPKEPVTYRLRVWQLMQGQNGVAAMRSNTPVIEKDVKEITQASVTGIYTGPCKPPYLCDFIWNVQALNREGKPMGRNNGMSESWSFGASSPTGITPPQNVLPVKDKRFSPEELKQSVTFQWTAVSPKPGEPVTYRIKVWQLMQGQNGTAAMRENKPIVTKDVDNITEATISGIYTGPCKPPFLCEYIWNVQALDREGHPLGENEGRSESWSFGATNPTSITGPSNVLPANNKKLTGEEALREIKFQWTAVSPKPGEPVTYRLKVWQLMQGQNGTAAMRENKPIVEKEMLITEASVAGIYTGPCKPPYLCDYIWMVEAVSKDGRTVAASEPTAFSVTEENVKCPANLFPEDKKKFSSEEAKKEMLFRWTPIVPKPQEPVTYRLKVWQLMQGQNGTAAMRENKPIVEKEMLITEASVSGIYTGPCRPPYLCDYIWMVEAVSKDGRTRCAGEPTTFSVTEENVKCPANLFPEDKKKITSEEAKKEMLFRWTPIVPKPQDPVTYRLKVWQLMQGQNGTAAMRENKPIVEKEMLITEASVSGIYTGPCRPPYLCDYIWMVEAVSKDGRTRCAGEPTTFSVTEENVKCPANLFPEDKKKFTSEEAKKEMLFRWTPIVPKPQEPVTYRLKVWQLMQGQSGTEAMRTNKPIVEKEMLITEASVSGIYTGPCRPPYLCDYVWIVEAVSKDGRTRCAGEPTTFSVTEENVKCPVNLFPEDKKKITSEEAKKEMLFRWTPIVPKPQEPVTYRLKVWQLMQGQNSTEAMRSNLPIVTKDVDNITEATISGIYTGPCRPPYLCDYIWQVQALNREGKPICSNEGKSETFTFKVEDNAATCLPPKLASPAEGKSFAAKDMSAPVLFRWTPIVPKPQQPVTYRLKVWQLMQGQNSTEAMRSNLPIVTKDVDNITEATISGIYTGPCRPPYLCEFIWNVQALNREGKPICSNEGKSETFTFKVEDNTATCSPPKLASPAAGKSFAAKDMSAPVLFRWTPIVPKPQDPVTYRIKVWQLMQGQNSTEAMRSNQPIVTKDVDNITEATISGIYTGPCRPPYLCDYIWQVQALNREGKPICSNEGKSEAFSFKVEDNSTSYSPPKLASPAEGKSFAAKDMSAPVLFRWTPIVPKPQEPVTYRIKVWQLMQGQNSTEAMRSNLPIVTKDVDNITEATISGIYTGPCRPPYLCDYIWQVQALNREGKPICSNEGKSEAFSFKVEDNSTSYSPPKLASPAEGKEFTANDLSAPVMFRWTHIVPKPQEPVTYRLKVWQLMEGQSGSQAMRSNLPIVTKDVDNITEATISGIYTGPCRPPYLCNYIWNVQALDREGKPLGTNNGTSEPWTFNLKMK